MTRCVECGLYVDPWASNITPNKGGFAHIHCPSVDEVKEMLIEVQVSYLERGSLSYAVEKTFQFKRQA